MYIDFVLKILSFKYIVVFRTQSHVYVTSNTNSVFASVHIKQAQPWKKAQHTFKRFCSVFTRRVSVGALSFVTKCAVRVRTRSHTLTWFRYKHSLEVCFSGIRFIVFALFLSFRYALATIGSAPILHRCPLHCGIFVVWHDRTSHWSVDFASLC